MRVCLCVGSTKETKKREAKTRHQWRSLGAKKVIIIFCFCGAKKIARKRSTASRWFLFFSHSISFLQTAIIGLYCCCFFGFLFRFRLEKAKDAERFKIGKKETELEKGKNKIKRQRRKRKGRHLRAKEKARRRTSCTGFYRVLLGFT